MNHATPSFDQPELFWKVVKTNEAVCRSGATTHITMKRTKKPSTWISREKVSTRVIMRGLHTLIPIEITSKPQYMNVPCHRWGS